jgi:hypothetical protein
MEGRERGPFLPSFRTSNLASIPRSEKVTPGCFLYTFSGGVRFSVPKGRLRPFARALFGVATLDACPIQGCESKGTFAQAHGGGVDLRISERRVGWRFQGDFLQTRFFGARQNDARFSTGLLIFFYKHSH